MIDLQSFCALPSEPREILHKPFRIGAWVYASNAHYCVRVPATDEPEVAIGKGVRNAADLFAKFAADEFEPMPRLARAPTCRTCKGSGVWRDGLGEDDCFECLGRGFAKWQRTRIGDADFELGYLNKMATLPNVQIHPRGPVNPMTLRFDGGEALLMPMIPLEEQT